MGFPTDIGIIDPGVGFPYTSVEQKKAAYEFMRPLYKDADTLDSMEFPAEYMFKDAPDVVSEGTDPIDWTIAEMDKWNVQVGVVGTGEQSLEAVRRHPGRFVQSHGLENTNHVMETVEGIRRAKDEHDIVSVGCFPCGIFPQVAIDDPKMYPVYATCVELDLPIFINAGIVGPRMPSWPQEVWRLDQVCYDFPELTIVTRHGCEPWEKLAMKLMLKWPGLHYCTSAFAPKHYPEEIVKFANTRGADKVMFTGYFPAGLSMERQFTEMAEYNPFKDEVWPKFLRGNAIRILKLDEKLGLEA